MAEKVLQTESVYSVLVKNKRAELINRIKSDSNITPDDPNLARARVILNDSDKLDKPEMGFMQAVAAYHGCPAPTPTYDSGEFKVTFDKQPTYFQLKNLVDDLKDIGESADAPEIFRNYYGQIKQKMSEAELNYILDYKKPKQSQRLKQLLLKDLDRLPFVSDGNWSRKIKEDSYVLTKDDVVFFIDLAEQNKGFIPNKKLTKMLGKVKSVEFADTLRNKRTLKRIEVPLNLALIGTQLFSVGGGILSPERWRKIISTTDATLAKPDNDVVRPLEAAGEIVSFGDYLYKNRNGDLVEAATNYLQDREKIDGVTRYLLTDYFESLENFPKEDRERLIEKSVDFVTECARLYGDKSDPDHLNLTKYLTEIAGNQEMQDLLGYTVLPFLEYVVSREDYANEQWLFELNEHFNNGEYREMIPYLEKIFSFIADYKPGDRIIDFRTPSEIKLESGEVITIPREAIDALNAIPPNPNYLPPGEFINASQREYVNEWHRIYGEDSDPPQMYWAPVFVQPGYVNKQLETNVFKPLGFQTENRFRTLMSKRDHVTDLNNAAVSGFQSKSNKDTFTYSTIGQPDSFQEIYTLFAENGDPYAKKFSGPESFFSYYQDYIHFIKTNGTPENPMLESKLFGYALVKCNGNLTQATMEMALAYKLMSRYDITDGSDSHHATRVAIEDATSSVNTQNFYRSIFLKENLPVLMSVTSQTEKGQDINIITKILLNQDHRLIDQIKVMNSGAWDGYVLGSKKKDIAEIWGTRYHRWSQMTLVFTGIGNPSAVGMMHVINEIPFRPDYNTLELLPNENSAYKPVELAKSTLDDIWYRQILQNEIPLSRKVENDQPVIQTFYVNAKSDNWDKITEVDEKNSSVVLSKDQKLYIGPTELIKKFVETGYAPVDFRSDVDTYPDFDANTLNTMLKSYAVLPGQYYMVDMYPDEIKAEVAQVLWQNGVNILDYPENLAYYLKFDFDIPRADIVNLLDIPEKHQSLISAVPYLAERGLIKPSDSLVEMLLEANTRYEVFEYYSRLSPEDQKTVLELYPDIEVKAAFQADSYIFNRGIYNSGLFMSEEVADRLFPLIVYSFDNAPEVNRVASRTQMLERINDILPYLSSEQITQALNLKNLTEEEKAIMFKPSTFVKSDKKNTDSERLQLVKIEKIVSNDPNLLLIMSPALLKYEIWSLDDKQQGIDNLLLSHLNKYGFDLLYVSDAFDQLVKNGYKPSKDVIKVLMSRASRDIEIGVDTYLGDTVFAEYSTSREFMTELDRLLDDPTEMNLNVVGMLFYFRFNKYVANRGDETYEMQTEEKDLLNNLIANPNFDLNNLIISEGGVEALYTTFGNNLSAESVLKIYEGVSNETDEINRYRLWKEITDNGHSLPEYVFDKDKFQKLLIEHPEFGYYVFEPEAKDFVKNNLDLSKFVELLSSLPKDKVNFFETYSNDSFSEVFNHDFISKLSSYSPELESKVADLLLQQLRSTENPHDYDLIPYLHSLRPEFDFGPYMVNLSIGTYDLKSKVEATPESKALFKQAISYIDSKYMAEILAADVDKFNYIQSLFGN